jgi:D-alanine-D-alanine ligase-like ATP-grasp enzyme/L-alanine-DL-glutamate epimerase-like enolase superfamily enzyme/acylphosphatase
MTVASPAFPNGLSLDSPPLAPGSVRITRARALAYQVPMRKKVRTNYLVLLELTDAHGRTVEGIGESQPREELTGDSEEHSWPYLEAALRSLNERELTLGDSESNLTQVRELQDELSQLARKLNHDRNQKRPYRGTLLGIEMALLDAFARGQRISVQEILGRRRDQAPGMPPSASSEASPSELRKLLRRQFGRYSRLRIKGSEHVEGSIEHMEKAAAVDRSRVGRCDHLPLWVEFNGAMTREAASRLVEEVALGMAAGFLPTEVLLEQPVPVKYGDHLPTLQKEADHYLRLTGREDLQLTVVGDESIWDQHSLGRLQKLGGLRAVTVRPAQAGGLLAALDLAQRAVKRHKAAFISLSCMDGAGLITRSALEHLALSMPIIEAVKASGFDPDLLPFARWTDQPFSTAKPDGAPNPDEREVLTAKVQKTRPVGRDQAVLRPRELPGLGLDIDYSVLVAEVQQFVQFPPLPEPTNEGQPAALYDYVEDVRPLGPNGTKGYLLEKRALARGLSTTRYSKSAFVVSDGVHPKVGFKWSRSSVSSAVAISVCTHKEATRLSLDEVGVPTPPGRTFRNGDFASARAFVDLIGFPVVVKPSMGIRGIGVVAGIENSAQLQGAFELMADSKFGGQDFIVEKHIKGRDHRILVVGGEVVGAIQRKPASAVGDGKSTLAELLMHRNVARRNNPHLWTRPAYFDATMAHQLDKLGLTLESVLPEGREVMLSNTANISQGADSIDVLDRLHPTIAEACKQAVEAIPGMQYCGVDFLLEDPAKPLGEQDAAIIELNAHAAIGNCEYPMFGTGRQVAQKLMDLTIDQYKLEARNPADELTVQLIIRGKVTGIGFRQWLAKHANRMEARGWVRNLNNRTLEAIIHGPTERVTPLIASCILGPPGAMPTSYQSTVLSPGEMPVSDAFELRDTPRYEDLTNQEREEIASLAGAEQDQYSEGDAESAQEEALAHQYGD